VRATVIQQEKHLRGGGGGQAGGASEEGEGDEEAKMGEGAERSNGV
jgi:hypothetical protein